MPVSLKHKFTSAKADGGDSSLVRPSNWNDEHDLVLSTGKLVGRSTAGAGAAEEISVGTGLTLSSGTLSAAPVAAYVKEYAFTGDTTTSVGTPVVELVVGQIPVADGATVSYTVYFAVAQISGASTTSGYFQVSGLAKNVGGTVSDIGTLHEVVVFNGGLGVAGVDCRAGSGGVDLYVFHEIAEAKVLRWRAYAKTVEVS